MNLKMDESSKQISNSYIPHHSSINISNLPRKTLYVTYNDISEGDLEMNIMK